jgi:hypothetical protein
MAVSRETRGALYQRAGGQCECRMRVCSHHRAGSRCPHRLNAGYWDAHHRTVGGPDNLGNLIAMCATCHKNTRTYGKE